MRTILGFVLCGVAGFAQTPTPHPLFGSDRVHEIKLTLADADWYQTLTTNYDGLRNDNPYFQASFECGPYKFDSIGVRFKGGSSYYAARTMKKPFRLKLNAFVSGQKIEGMGALNLSNAWNDPSFVRENIYYGLAASLGLKAPRSNFAALYINGQYWGLYVLDEVVNDDFLKSYFGGKDEDDGNLYKAGYAASLADLGDDKENYKMFWQKQTNEDADDWSDLISLTHLINDTPVEQLHDALEPVMDTDSVLTALALDNATVNLDSYAGTATNYNLYRRPSDNRWVWIVWDPSLAFGGMSQGQSIDVMKSLKLEWLNSDAIVENPNPNIRFPRRPLAAKLWAVPEYRERYRQIYAQLIDQYFKPQKLVHRMNQLRWMIRPYVEFDTQKLVTMEQFDQAMSTDQPFPNNQDIAIPGLRSFVRARANSIRTQLATDPVPTLTVAADTAALDFAAEVGSKADAQMVSIDSSANASYFLSSKIRGGGNWLTLAQAGGALPGAFKVSVSAAGLDAGVYTGTIIVHVPASANGPIVIPVTLTITPPATESQTDVSRRG